MGEIPRVQIRHDLMLLTFNLWLLLVGREAAFSKQSFTSGRVLLEFFFAFRAPYNILFFRRRRVALSPHFFGVRLVNRVNFLLLMPRRP